EDRFARDHEGGCEPLAPSLGRILWLSGCRLWAVRGAHHAAGRVLDARGTCSRQQVSVLVEQREATCGMSPCAVDGDEWCVVIPQREATAGFLTERKDEHEDSRPLQDIAPPLERLG